MTSSQLGAASIAVSRLPRTRRRPTSYALLRELIISGEAPTDEQLLQRDLALRFGLSQTPVREALRRLETQGLVLNDPHRGATVAQSEQGAVEDQGQVRAVLEALGARMAARDITSRGIQELRALNAVMACGGR